MTKEKKQNGEVVETDLQQEEVIDPTPVKVPCVVGVNAGHTINVGEYSTVKVGVFLSVTVEPGDIDEAFEAVSEWVGERLGQMVEAVSDEMSEEDDDD